MYLTDLQSIRPSYESSQQETLDWLIDAHVIAENGDEAFRTQLKENLARFGCKPGQIDKRGHVGPDSLHRNWEEMDIYRLKESCQGAHLGIRMKQFSHHADRIFEQFYETVDFAPEDLIHVTCTGYVSPSGAQKIISKKNWGAQTTVTHAYHMGCYGSIVALRMGKGFLLSDPAKSQTDVVHTEICSLHANPYHHQTDQLISQSLFADGFIKYSLVKKIPPRITSLQVHTVREELITDSLYAMSWIIGSHNFEMTLAKEIPVLIARALQGFLERLAIETHFSFSELCQKALFAIHPGGPKILHHIQKILNLTDKQMAYSFNVLQNMGNMSSATLPHIWKQILENEPEKTPIVSLAFGPGLTICGAIMEIKCGG